MLPGERNSWPKKRWVASVGRHGATFRTLTEAKRWVGGHVMNGKRSWWLNSVIVQSGTGSTYQGRTTRVEKKPVVRWTKLSS